jgi:hypothetical protein
MDDFVVDSTPREALGADREKPTGNIFRGGEWIDGTRLVHCSY